MIALKTRLKMAWFVFKCKPFCLLIEPYHGNGELNFGYVCDNSWRHRDIEPCENRAVICLTRTEAEFRLNKDDHEHLCQECANKIMGKY